VAERDKPVTKLTLSVETIRRLTFGVQWNPGTEACRPPRLTPGCPSRFAITNCVKCEPFLDELGQEVVEKTYMLEPQDPPPAKPRAKPAKPRR